jgi:alkylation response protein AidB-like acyl-CoA dehydrogenase
MLDTNKKPTILFSDEQEQLLEVAANFCRDRFPMSETRKRIEAEEDFNPKLWSEMASLGWLGIAVPEEFGGSGLTLAEVVTVVEPMGECLAGTPLVSTTHKGAAGRMAAEDLRRRHRRIGADRAKRRLGPCRAGGNRHTQRRHAGAQRHKDIRHRRRLRRPRHRLGDA